MERVAETARQERAQGGQPQAEESGDPVVNRTTNGPDNLEGAAKDLPASDSCTLCLGARWICEDHPDQPLGHSTANGKCDAAGMPCAQCNPLSELAPHSRDK